MWLHAGDDAFDLALDTREVLSNGILGPLAAGALQRVARGIDPEEAVFPITKGLFGLPSPVPVPKLERIYFRHAHVTAHLCSPTFQLAYTWPSLTDEYFSE